MSIVLKEKHKGKSRSLHGLVQILKHTTGYTATQQHSAEKLF